MTWSFRLAGPQDTVSIAHLVNSAYRGDSSRLGWTTEADILGGQRTNPDSIRGLVTSHSKVILAMENTDGRLVGCVYLERRPDRVAYLGMLSVDPGQQTQGLGKALMWRAEEYAREEWDSTAIEMTVISRRPELIAWYERRGYALTGQTERFPGDDPRIGIPLVDNLEFVVLRKALSRAA
jgi:GNAT superfamily N-acetyltransferase